MSSALSLGGSVSSETSLKAECTCLTILENENHLLTQKDVLEY